jgi:methylated-DNA-[protein]-cysteine S-methyltransferase
MAQSGLATDVFQTKWGWVALCASGRGLRGVLLPVARKADAARWLREAAGDADGPSDPAAARLIGKVRKRIEDYFAGRSVSFGDVPLDLSDQPPFRRSALAALAKVGYGRRVTYGELAAAAGNASAARAAGGACARNPMPLVIPCHRVLSAGGRLGGFSAAGGVSVKRRMLAMEAGGGNVRR